MDHWLICTDPSPAFLFPLLFCFIFSLLPPQSSTISVDLPKDEGKKYSDPISEKWAQVKKASFWKKVQTVFRHKQWPVIIFMQMNKGKKQKNNCNKFVNTAYKRHFYDLTELQAKVCYFIYEQFQVVIQKQLHLLPKQNKALFLTDCLNVSESKTPTLKISFGIFTHFPSVISSRPFLSHPFNSKQLI